MTHSLIFGCQTESSLVEKTGDLDVRWRFNELANEFQAIYLSALNPSTEGGGEWLTRR